VIRYNVEMRAEVDGNAIVGHASVFGQVANVGPHWEQIERTAFDQVLRSTPDTRALINHDPNMVLGRTVSGTLDLDTDGEGLAFRVDLPDTSYANDLRVLVARGDVTGASFGFIPGDDRWERAPDGRQLRTHTSVSRLLDVSVVTFPAYEGAGVALRSADFHHHHPNRSTLVRARARVLFSATNRSQSE
jgi:HK97 family phage prohead protease